MPDPTKRSPHYNEPTTPENFPTTSSAPSGDYSYTLEIVMHMKESMGRLLEAVEGLKTDSKEYRDELKTIGKEIHAAKVGFRWAVGLCMGFGALIGWAITTYISATHK
jgi:hypothetical protein